MWVPTRFLKLSSFFPLVNFTILPKPILHILVTTWCSLSFKYVSKDRCLDSSYLSVENRIYQPKWTETLLNSWACFTLALRTVFWNYAVSSQIIFHLSFSQSSLNSSWKAASSVTKRAFSQSDSAVNGLMRNVIWGRFSFRSHTSKDLQSTVFSLLMIQKLLTGMEMCQVFPFKMGGEEVEVVNKCEKQIFHQVRKHF